MRKQNYRIFSFGCPTMGSILQMFIISCTICVSHAYTQNNFWFKTNGPRSSAITSMTVNSYNHIFAATHNSGVFETSDNGNTWVKIGLDSLELVQIISMRNDYIFVTSNKGVYKSIDLGHTWVQCSKGLGNTSSTCISYNKKGTIFVSSGGLYRSSDNGDNWINVTTNEIKLVGTIYSIATNSLGFVYVGGGNGIVRSIDDGNSWIKTNLWEERIPYLAVASDDKIYACLSALSTGLRLSNDNGDSWSLFGLFSYQIQAIITKQSRYIYTSARKLSDMYFIYTQNNGISWIYDNSGLENMHITTFAISNDDYLVAGTDSGYVFRTTNNITSVDNNTNLSIQYQNTNYNFPNPFSQSTIISFQNEVVATTNIIIYNMQGKIIRHLFEGVQLPGRYEYIWDGTDDQEKIVHPGLYICDIKSKNDIDSKHLIFKLCYLDYIRQ